MAIFKGAKNRDDTFVGGGRPDTFLFDPADLTSGDTIVGGNGRSGDTLRLTAAGAIGASALAGVSQIERIMLADGANSLVLNDALVSTGDGARVAVVGGAGDDLVDASSLTGANAIDVFAGAGADVLTGGAGGDTFHFSSDALDGLDTIDGGNSISVTATDTLEITGDVALASDALANVTAIEAFQISGGGGMRLALTQAIFDTAQDHRITVTGGAGADVIDASATDANAYDGGLTVNGGDGDDVITGAFQQYSSGHVFQTFIDGGAGRDTIDVSNTVLATVVYDAADIRLAAFAGTLIVDGGIHLDLTRSDDQSLDDDVIVQGFFQVDASASQEAVNIFGTGDGTLIGGSGADYLANAHYIQGGRGADTMVGHYTIFTIGLHDFAAGETIVGGGSSGLNVTGSVDFRTGDVSGIFGVNIRNAPDAVRPTHLIFSADEASQFGQISGTADGPTAIVDIRADAPTTLDLSGLNVNYADLTIYGSYGDDTINSRAGTIYGGGGNDTITCSIGTVHGGRGDDILGGTARLYGDAGNDTMTYSDSDDPRFLSGGSGVDTLLGGYSTYATIRLGAGADQTLNDGAVVRGFENVDWTYNEGEIDCVGSGVANHLIGGLYDDRISGGGGDDIVEGGHGNDTLRGGAGSDTFVWSQDVGGPDTIRDFTVGEDVFQFDRADFNIAGGRFDHRLVSGETSLNVRGIDLLVYTGHPINNVNDVQALLSSASARDGDGMFVVATDDAGHTVLFHTSDAAAPQFYQVEFIADLGRQVDPLTVDLSSFTFG